MEIYFDQTEKTNDSTGVSKVRLTEEGNGKDRGKTMQPINSPIVLTLETIASKSTQGSNERTRRRPPARGDGLEELERNPTDCKGARQAAGESELELGSERNEGEKLIQGESNGYKPSGARDPKQISWLK